MFWTKKEPQPPKSQGNLIRDCVSNFLVGSGIVTIVNVFSGKLISAYGFTKLGILAKSMAATLQSKIILVKVGSWFATFQSFGALKLGILGPYFIPVAIGVGILFAMKPLIKKAFTPKIQQPKPVGISRIKQWWSPKQEQFDPISIIGPIIGLTAGLAFYYLFKKCTTKYLKAGIIMSGITLGSVILFSQSNGKPVQVTAKSKSEDSGEKTSYINRFWGKKEENSSKKEVTAKSKSEDSGEKTSYINRFWGKKEENSSKKEVKPQVTAKNKSEDTGEKTSYINRFWGKKEENSSKPQVTAKSKSEDSGEKASYINRLWGKKEAAKSKSEESGEKTSYINRFWGKKEEKK